MDNAPYILNETDDFIVVYKPAKMHCIPRSNQSESWKDDRKKNRVRRLTRINADEEKKQDTLCAFVRLCGKNNI